MLAHSVYPYALLLCFATVFSSSATAGTVTVTVAELDTAIQEMDNDRNALEQLVIQRIAIRPAIDQTGTLRTRNVRVDLPAPTDEQVTRLYSLLSADREFSLSLGYPRVKRVELLAALLAGDADTLQDLLSTAAVCEAAGLLQAELPRTPVYHLDDNGCETLADDRLAEGLVDSGAIYTDAQCQSFLDYQPTTNVDFCAYVLDTEKLGNAEADPQTLDRWTLSPGTRFDIGALPLQGKLQPFTQRVNYKQVVTAQGECSLEMRIHTLTPDTSAGNNNASQVLKPLIAFHGGSWQRRSSGALGIESVATQFTNEGYVVFAPFYRLIGTEEGNAACNDASLTDVLEDANDALDWVNANASRYGAAGKPVVFGQSAGGHMSAVLAVERPDELAAAVLFYAPTDFTDFANQIATGEIDSATGQSILETVVGQTLDTLDVNAPLIRRNTLTTRILDESIATPPFFLLHGMNDTVLPFRQSVRFCDALTGDADAGPASASIAAIPNDVYRRIVTCGFDGSELHLITEGEHALDLCIADDLCLAGSPASARKTSDSMQRMLDWLREVQSDEAQLTVNDGDGTASDSSSGGSMTLATLLFMMGCSACRLMRLCKSRVVVLNHKP